MIKNCKQCNINFKTRRSISKFCDVSCYIEYQKDNLIFSKKRIGKISTSQTRIKQSKSMKSFFITNQEAREIKRKYALNNGVGKWMKGRKLPLDTRIKMSTAFSGQNHWNWQGGKNSESEKIRKSFKYREWRKNVFTRDNWTCQDCHIRGFKLHAHHLLPFSQFPNERLSLKNGVTLCDKCHLQRHTKKVFSTQVNNTKVL